MKGLLVGLALLAALLVGGDVLAAGAAERLVAEQVRTELGTGTQVDVAVPRPFLPQLVRGRYSEVVVEVSGSLPGVRVDSARLVLRGAQVPLGDALGGDVQRVPVEALRLRAAVPWSELTRLAPEGVVVEPADGGLVRVVGSVEVLGREASAAAVAEVQVDQGRLQVRPQRFETGSGIADALLERVAGDRFSFALDPGPLPYGLVPTAVRVERSALVLRAASGPAVLQAESPVPAPR